MLGDYQVKPLGKHVGTDVEFGKGGLTIGLEPGAPPYAPRDLKGGKLFGTECGNEPADLWSATFRVQSVSSNPQAARKPAFWRTLRQIGIVDRTRSRLSASFHAHLRPRITA